MIVACGLSRPDAEALATSTGAAVRAVRDLAGAMRSLGNSRDDALVIVGPQVSAADAFHFTGRARALRPGTVVVLLRLTVNRLERELARAAGVEAILPAGDISAAGRSCRAYLGAPSARRGGSIVTVFAAKGGCGKTMLATNLAVALAENAGRRVCLVDLDLRFGDLAVTLGIEPVRTIVSGAGGPAAMVTAFRPGLDCVLAPTGPGEAERLEVDGVDESLADLSDSYDVVVVDTPATFTRPVVAALDRSEHHVLVATPERPALQSLRKTLDTLDLLGHRRDSRSVVFNRSDSGVGITADDVERALHAPIAAHIPSSRDVPASINGCAPLMVTSPDHPVSTAIRDFARARLAARVGSPSPSGAP